MPHIKTKTITYTTPKNQQQVANGSKIVKTNQDKVRVKVLLVFINILLFDLNLMVVVAGVL